MRKILTYTSIIAAATVFAGSCENAKFLDQYPYSQTSPENFYTSESSINMGLVGCYEIINGHKIPGASYVQRGSYGQGLIYVMNCPSDDMVAATSSSDEGLEMTWGNYNESTRCVRDTWKVMYTGISRCNTLLHYVDKVGLDPAVETQYIAEARFLRAFFYYHLAWNFGGVPIVEEYDSDGSEPRASLKDVYDFIFKDLDFAYSNLNEIGILQSSSANKYTAAAYIARICNYLAACKNHNVGAELVAEQPLNDFSFVDADAMYAKAQKACEDIIDNSSYVLIPDYTNLFRETTKAQQYQECLLLAEQPLSGSEGYWPNSFYLPSPTNNSDSPTVYGGRFVPTPRAFYMYSPKDPRRDHNITGRLQDLRTDGTPGKIEVDVDGYTYYIPDPPRSEITVKDENDEPVLGLDGQPEKVRHPLYDTDSQTYLPVAGIQCCAGKFRLCKNDQLQRSYQQHAMSYPLIRLADVYLMYAEALAFGPDKNESKAREQLRTVLLRAAGNNEDLCEELMTAYHRDNFLDELLESRERELIFEFSRKWDLIRFNLMDEKIGSLNEDMVIERYVENPEDPDYIDPDYLNFQSDGYLKLGIPTIKQNWEPHKIWLPISEEQIGVNKSLTQNAGW